MEKNKIFQKILFSIMFCTGLESSQGNFDKKSFESPLKISLKTKDFLKQMIDLQQNFLIQRQACQLSDVACVQVVQSMMQLNQQVFDAQEISKKMQADLFAIVHVARQTLFDQVAPEFCNVRDQALKNWWYFLEKSLDGVQVQGYQQDFLWLCEQAGQLMYAYRLHLDTKQLKTIAIRSVTMCQELMQKFNGLLVNDYDLLVLANFVVVLLAVQC